MYVSNKIASKFMREELTEPIIRDYSTSLADINMTNT